MKRIAVFLLLLSTVPWLNAQSPRIITATSISLHGTPLYKDGFTHFEYVNPNAPKGGRLVLSAIGTYDNFHRYALRGNSADGIEYLYDSLLRGSEDELDAYYPLIAEKFDYADDYSTITFYINRAAKDQDGVPITAEDVAFSFNIFMTKGVPQFRAYYQGVTATVLDTYRIRFNLPESGNKELMVDLGTLAVLPKRFWQNGTTVLHDFSEPLITPPIGTGPYRIGDYKMGQYVVLERVKNYWAADLPINKGQFNIDTIRYDYYRDTTIAFEAFKAGEYDFRSENVARNWATQYTGRIFDSGQIVRKEIAHEIPQSMQAFTFNIQRPVFQDRLVRQALNYFFDFEWMNKNLFYDQYTRTRSYFQNTPYEARGLPSAAEQKILEPIRNSIPREVFTQEYNPSTTDGSGNIQSQAREALRLLTAAGWELRQGKMVNKATGRQMEFELLIYDNSTEQIAVPLQRNLERYGINMRIRTVDVTQYINRLRSLDYDIVGQGFGANSYPSSSLLSQWHSKYIDSTWNTAGVQDPAIDYLIEGILEHQGNEADLLAWGHALDRVLTWNFYVIPQWHIKKFRLAYKNNLAQPSRPPKYAIGLDSWWVKP
ncbi:extracellular solute-binding protein [Pillotina sp. SPG140]|jgi:microcin C transport system substrate-binding protein